MTTRVCGLLILALVLSGCASKTERQQVTDAVRTELSKRGEPRAIDCAEPVARGWFCVASMRHSRKPYASCRVDARRSNPIARCRDADNVVIFK
jgi:hypothetical protein